MPSAGRRGFGRVPLGAVGRRSARRRRPCQHGARSAAGRQLMPRRRAVRVSAGSARGPVCAQCRREVPPCESVGDGPTRSGRHSPVSEVSRRHRQWQTPPPHRPLGHRCQFPGNDHVSTVTSSGPHPPPPIPPPPGQHGNGPPVARPAAPRRVSAHPPAFCPQATLPTATAAIAFRSTCAAICNIMRAVGPPPRGVRHGRCAPGFICGGGGAATKPTNPANRRPVGCGLRPRPSTATGSEIDGASTRGDTSIAQSPGLELGLGWGRDGLVRVGAGRDGTGVEPVGQEGREARWYPRG